MSSDKRPQDDELYEFNNDYLHELNEIRRQLNLEEIHDSEPAHTHSEDEVQPQQQPGEETASPLPSCSHLELYQFDSTYINDLNAVRKRLNLSELRLDVASPSEEEPPALQSRVSVHVETVSDYTSSEDVDEDTVISYRERGKSSEYVSEESSTARTISTSHGFRSPFSIPDDDETAPITPTVTILNNMQARQTQRTIAKNKILPLDLRNGSSSNSESTQQDESARTVLSSVRNPDLRTSLDMPRKSMDHYEFPDIVNVSHWVQALTTGVELEQVCPGRSMESGDKLAIFDVHRHDTGYREKVEEMLAQNVPNEIETASSLSNMNRCRQTVDMRFYDMESETKSEQGEISDDAVDGGGGKCCSCFRMCFVKKRKKYFS